MKAHALLFAAAIMLSACVHAPSPGTSAPTASAQLQGVDSRPAQASHWARSELYFGVGEESGVADRPQGAPIDEAQWRSFLDREVTPRFPDGLTVFDAYGPWLFRGAAQPNRLKTKVLVILHEDTPQRRADIDAIRLAWKRETGHQSVLWAQQAVEVSF